MWAERLGAQCVALLVGAATCAAATTGQMAGRVLDQGGNAVAGATISIRSEALIGGPRTRASNEDGRFLFRTLPLGEYEVEAGGDGFLPETARLQVRLDRVAAVTIRLVPVAFSGEIEVSTDVPVVDTTQVSAGVVFSESHLQMAAVGSSRRSLLDTMWQAPGVTGSSVFGGTVGDNAFLVDGMNTSDPAQGLSGADINFDAIEEMNLKTGGFEAEYGLATGGVISLVTKSGGNQLSGSVDVRHRGRSFVEDGDHYASDEQESMVWLLSATAGGPIVRDRAWFFVAVGSHDESEQLANESFPRHEESTSWLGKLTWQPEPSLRAVLSHWANPARVIGSNAGENIDVSASQTTDETSTLWMAELGWVLGDSALLDLQVGTLDSSHEPYPSHGDADRSLHVNEDTDSISSSSGLVWGDDRRRDEYRLTGTLFVDDLAGSHELEAGVVYSDQSFGYTFWLTGGAIVADESEPPGREYVDLNGDGYFNHYLLFLESQTGSREPLSSSGDISTVYVQDAWRPLPNLTIKPGLRLDAVRHTNHTGELIADMSRWQPRLGVAWDVLGSARHVLRASAGRFMDPSALSLAGFTSFDRSIREYNTLEYVCNGTNGLLCDAESLPWQWWSFTNPEGIEYILIDNRATQVAQWQTVDQLGVDRLQTPHSDQLILAWESQLAAETSLELSWVSKRTRELLEDTCSNNRWVWGATPPPSLEDRSSWTPAAGCTGRVLANIPGLERSYEAAQARLESRRKRLHLLASYTWSKSRGTSVSGPAWYMYDNGDYFPAGFVNWYGYMPDDRRHRIKLNGYMLLPRQWTLALGGFWSSPGHLAVAATCEQLIRGGDNPNGRARLSELGVDPDIEQYCFTREGVRLDSNEILLRPRGDFETKSVWQVDLQVTKTFHLGRVSLSGIFTVLNLFGRELDRTFNDRAFRQEVDGDDNPVYDEAGNPVYMPVGAPLSYWLPRRYELGLRVEF